MSSHLRQTMCTVLQLLYLIAMTTGGSATYNKLSDTSKPTEKSEASPELPVGLQCPRVGVFKVPGSCRQFYQCDEVPGSGMISTLFSCPQGAMFDDRLKICKFVYQVAEQSECIDEGNAPAVADSIDASAVEVVVDGSFPLKRQKRMTRATVSSPGLTGLGSLMKARWPIPNASTANKVIRSGSVDLKSLENRLSGMEGKLKGLNISVLESSIVSRINSEVTQSLITRGTAENQISFEIAQDLINQGILENRINVATTQGLIIQGKIANELNFGNVQVSIGELKQFVSREINKAKSDISKGFERVLSSIDQSRIGSLVSKLLTLITGFNERRSHLQGLPDINLKDEIERSGGFIEYLESSTLQDTLYDIIYENMAVPSSSEDMTAVFILDMLVQGLQIHANMLSSVVSSNVYLADKALEERSLDEFNTYMLRVGSSTRRMKVDLGHNGDLGLIGEVKNVLHVIKQLQYAPLIPGLNDFLSVKEAELSELESDVNELITAKTGLVQPGRIRGKPNFSVSSSSIPLGPWENGKRFSYAIQFASDKGLSKVGQWSSPYTVLDKANPIIRLPSAEEGLMRLVYRKFDGKTPELVAIVLDRDEVAIRDIGRDLINAASNPNENLAINEVTALIDDGADVNVTLEDNMTPLHYAAKHGNIEIMRILSNETADIRAKSTDNEEPLHMAALFGSGEAIEFLVNKGAFINAQTKSLQWAPLHIAVINNHVNATRVLMQKGALVNVKDVKGLTPLHLSVLGNGETMEVLLEDVAVLDVNAVSYDGLTPLHYAARSSKAYYTKMLLERGDVEVNALTESQMAPLHLAAMSGNVETITELISHGASVSFVDGYGASPLHYAAFYGNLETVLLLLKKDHTLKSLKNFEGKTALDLATENNNVDVIQILRNETEYIINRLREEIEKSKVNNKPVELDSADQALPDGTLKEVTCTQQVVQEMAELSEETCVHIGHITNYVDIVKSNIPLHVQYDGQVGVTNIINSYNNVLQKAKSNANSWKDQDSLLGAIERTFKLAKDFGSTFKRKYEINQIRSSMISQDVNINEIIASVRREIQKLESDLRVSQEAVINAVSPQVKEFLENHIKVLQQELAAKQSQISGDPTTMRKLQEFIDFLRFVEEDTSKIEREAAEAIRRTKIFSSKMKADNELFERNSRSARNSLQSLLSQSISNNKDLANIQQMEDQLQHEIDEQKRSISQFYDQMYETHRQLRVKRRELLQKMEKISNVQLLGAIVTPISPVIGIPLLSIASKADKTLISEWQANLNHNKAEAARLEGIVQRKQQLIAQNREIIANGSTNTETLRRELNVISQLDRDLQDIIVDLPSLQPSLSHAIVSLEKISGVFRHVTRELRSIIRSVSAAESAEEKENALNSVHLRLAELQCYWKDIGLYLMDLRECSQNYKIVKPKQPFI